MVHITITVEGEANDVRVALASLIGVTTLDSLNSQSPQSNGDARIQDSVPSPWTVDELSTLWDYLTPAAQQILARVAMQPDGVPFHELERDMERDMKVIGGNLSSVGHAMRRLFAIGDSYLKPWPIHTDFVMRRYRMDREVAGMIRAISMETEEGVS